MKNDELAREIEELKRRVTRLELAAATALPDPSTLPALSPPIAIEHSGPEGKPDEPAPVEAG